MKRLVIPALLSVALAAGCSNPEHTAAPTTTVTSPREASPSSATSSAPPSSSQPVPKAATADASAGMLGSASMEDQPLTRPEQANLIPVEVRTGHHEGFDRVVIEFEGSGKPGWYTQYTDQPAAQASGKPVEYPGNTALVVGVEGTPWPSTPELEAKYLKPGNFPGAGQVAGVRYVNSFESQSQFVIGLHSKRPHAVTYLDDRLVIDFPSN